MSISWIAKSLGLDPAVISVVPISTDASFRHYYRVFTAMPTEVQSVSCQRRLASSPTIQSYVWMVSPPQLENPAPFVHINHMWRVFGLPVPTIHAIEWTEGWLLLDDFGDALYATLLTEDTADRLYQTALHALSLLSQAPEPPEHSYPSFNIPFMWKEIGYFTEWFLPHHIRYLLSASEEMALKTEVESILQNIVSQPQGVVHRDYHSRNLLQTPTGLGILDFQDAVRGPLLYDPASLLKDAYIAWPEEKVWDWLRFFCRHSALHSVPFSTCVEWFDFVCLQRHLKVLGIFARLAYRDQKKRYLDDMPRVANYITQTLSRYTMFPALTALFQNHITPFMIQWEEKCVP